MDTARHARVKEVFLAVVALPPEERRVALDQACGDDPSLCAEVQSLLSHHSDDSLLESRNSDEAASDTVQAAPPIVPS